MSWLDDVHASDPAAWESMAQAGRIPSAYTANDRQPCHDLCVDEHGHVDACIVVEDE